MTEETKNSQTESLGWYEDEGGFMDLSLVVLCEDCAGRRGPAAVYYAEVGESVPAECEYCGIPNAMEARRKDHRLRNPFTRPTLKVVR